MKCINCDACKLGWFESRPEEYVCIGVKHPFVIADTHKDCTQYPEKNKTLDKVGYKIVKNTNGVYDLFNNGEWVLSRNHPDNIFSELVNIGAINNFVDKEVLNND